MHMLLLGKVEVIVQFSSLRCKAMRVLNCVECAGFIKWLKTLTSGPEPSLSSHSHWIATGHKHPMLSTQLQVDDRLFLVQVGYLYILGVRQGVRVPHIYWRTSLESFYPRTVWLSWSRSILGWNDSPGVVLSQDSMTPLESFYPRTEWLPCSRSMPG